MKKLLLLSAAFLVMQAVPALAQDESGAGPRAEKRNAMFEKHDGNGDGVISEKEFLAGAKERFKKMDLNGDGKVTKEEGRSAHEKMREEMKSRRDERRSERPSDSGAKNFSSSTND